MASSKKKLPDPTAHVAQFLDKRVQPGQHLVLALSGGVDSVVLLDILADLRGPLQFRLSAIHVNHQLSPHASDWAAFCAARCQDYGVPLEIASVTVSPAPATAWKQQHAPHVMQPWHVPAPISLFWRTTSTTRSRPCYCNCCAVVAWQAQAPWLNKTRRLLRPLLELPRTALEHYARQHKLAWVEDESNLDTRFDRNFLRHRLLPVVEERFPAYRETLYRASRNFAESAYLQDELARLDGAKAIDDKKLSVPALARLPPAPRQESAAPLPETARHPRTQRHPPGRDAAPVA